MLTDEIMERLICHKSMTKLCVSSQSEIMQMFEEILREVKEAYPYATISELLDE